MGFRALRFRALGFKGLGFRFREAPYRLPLWTWAPKGHPYHGFGEPNSIIVVSMEPLGYCFQLRPYATLAF